MQNLQSNPLQGLWSTVCRLFMLTTFFVGFGLTATPDAKALSGAIYTTDVDGTNNQNVGYDTKADVYLQGGPNDDHPNAAQIVPDGFYHCQVTTPNGVVLGQSDPLNPPIQVINGSFVTSYQLIAILFKASDGTPGFDDTNSSGGVYKVWLSTTSAFLNSESKTDNFKVKEFEGPPPPDPTPTGELCVVKFYDANANGLFDPGEVEITGWLATITGAPSVIPPAIPVPIQPILVSTPSCTVLDVGTYSVLEKELNDATRDHWVHTAAFVTVNDGIPFVLPGSTLSFVPDIQLLGDDHTTVYFGNVCIGAGGGKTLGFWSNKNGQKLIGADDLALLSALTLRNANGSDFNPGSAGALRTWLLNGNAVNMAYMLSVQLTAMELNVHNELVTAGHKIYAPDLSDFLGEGDGLNPLGFISIEDLMDAAEAALVADGDTLAGDSNRAYQEALKDALDDANNNLNFLQAAPCPFSFATP